MSATTASSSSSSSAAAAAVPAATDAWRMPDGTELLHPDAVFLLVDRSSPEALYDQARSYYATCEEYLNTMHKPIDRKHKPDCAIWLESFIQLQRRKLTYCVLQQCVNKVAPELQDAPYDDEVREEEKLITSVREKLKAAKAKKCDCAARKAADAARAKEAREAKKKEKEARQAAEEAASQARRLAKKEKARAAAAEAQKAKEAARKKAEEEEEEDDDCKIVTPHAPPTPPSQAVSAASGKDDKQPTQSPQPQPAQAKKKVATTQPKPNPAPAKKVEVAVSVSVSGNGSATVVASSASSSSSSSSAAAAAAAPPATTKSQEPKRVSKRVLPTFVSTETSPAGEAKWGAPGPAPKKLKVTGAAPPPSKADKDEGKKDKKKTKEAEKEKDDDDEDDDDDDEEEDDEEDHGVDPTDLTLDGGEGVLTHTIPYAAKLQESEPLVHYKQSDVEHEMRHSVAVVMNLTLDVLDAHETYLESYAELSREWKIDVVTLKFCSMTALRGVFTTGLLKDLAAAHCSSINNHIGAMDASADLRAISHTLQWHRRYLRHVYRGVKGQFAKQVFAAMDRASSAHELRGSFKMKTLDEEVLDSSAYEKYLPLLNHVHLQPRNVERSFAKEAKEAQKA